MIQKISTQIPKYEILEEIHATSYPAYINTEIKSGYNISIEVKYKNVEPFESGTYRRIFSTDAEWNDKRTLAVNYNDSKLKVKFIGEIIAINTGILYDTTSEHTVYLSSEYFNYDGKTYLSRIESVWTSSYDIIIAQSFYKSSLDQGYYNYYYVKIWDNDTLVRDYVPVKRLSDNIYGLYDYVNDTFYSSAGTAEFTGTSKAEPEYIYDNQAQTLYVNDIIINNTHINRIYNKGEIYWGGDATSTPPPAQHLIHGTSTYTSNFNIKLNNQNVEVTVDPNTGEFWLDSWSGTLTDLATCFDYLQNILTIDQFNLDTSQVISFENFVNRCFNLSFVDTSNLNTSNASHLGGMFAQCHNLTSLDLSNFDTYNVTTIQYIFYYSEHITSLNLNNWDLSRCSSYNVWAFQQCSSLTDVYINVESTLMKLTNNLSSQGDSYIPSSATIHYNDVHYKWQNNAWTPQN